ncbi:MULTISPECIES: ribose 5-phosphate isomerase B [Vibrio]|jgi:ribose 5-phosphate isomerase B|uniref:Ribose 5-phosphate isomerase B n=1 Tax=Vibrio mediterranei TaxID=689 RepID=A0A2C9PFC4_9VIBR|nr:MULTISPECIES: ribose 5-phosphate isomerase B [Vibrio]ASI91315.1 ribose 5-phosphate isomerase B [Vibrio mediterranei]AYV20206.1 ribose 5-phosphate isomerase B [Vibrio mediterranei]EDL52287.1 ribose-5-phosphate isomerase B [Vibrio mediterranei AK1]MCG9623640.1 ribose 5-phosphate isomerase B [Vibrio mediterranei]MCG9661942.1 ribose 5-phosphate isomerase B [Vibrio mediterranei]
MIAIGCDDAAVDLKECLKAHLAAKGIEYVDYGIDPENASLYPDIAKEVSLAVSAGKHERGIILCGTGIGVSIVANKVPGIRAALCHDTFSAERARKSNDAQIITMGSRVIGSELAKAILDTWLDSEFSDGPSTPKVNRIKEIEKEFIG